MDSVPCTVRWFIQYSKLPEGRKHGIISCFHAGNLVIKMETELTEFIQTLSGDKRNNDKHVIVVDPDTLLRT